MAHHEEMSEYTVGKAARVSGVSVRTLHHYDEIGLLHPSVRGENGYRLYTAEDLTRLRQIRVYRDLDFRLEEIAEILADPGVGAEDHLRRQHRLLRDRRARDRRLLRAIENEMEVRSMGMSLTPEEQFEVFGTDRLSEYADEAEQRWGDTEAFRHSRRRTASYTKADWTALKREADANVEAFASTLAAGEPATGTVAMDLADAHRRHVSSWFYDCSPSMHRGLAELYVADPRFTARYDRVAPGLARYVRAAILAAADRGEIGERRD